MRFPHGLDDFLYHTDQFADRQIFATDDVD